MELDRKGGTLNTFLDDFGVDYIGQNLVWGIPLLWLSTDVTQHLQVHVPRNSRGKTVLLYVSLA